MSEDLKPCPFCGGVPRHNTIFDIAECYNCGGQASIDTWNIRHIPEGYALVAIFTLKQMAEMIAAATEKK